MDGGHRIVLITDHSSMEGSRDYLSDAAKYCTGEDVVLLDAQNFTAGGGGRMERVAGGVRLIAPLDDCSVISSTVIIYEVPPERRRGLAPFQKVLRDHKVNSLGVDPEPWQVATEKDLTVETFARCGVPHMETVALDKSSSFEDAFKSFLQLGGNVWARPAVGMGGYGVFHVDSIPLLHRAYNYYGAAKWLISRDALNFNTEGKRHQYRMVVLEGAVIQVCEHVQNDPDSPCNESQGAVATPLPASEWPADLCRLAIFATKSVGLRFSGVDLVREGGGVVFEVNVHPAFGPWPLPGTTAIPYVRAHLEKLSGNLTVPGGTGPGMVGRVRRGCRATALETGDR